MIFNLAKRLYLSEVFKMPKREATIDFRQYVERLDQDRKEAEKRSLALEKRLVDDAKEREKRSLALEKRLMDDAKEREQRSQEREQRSREESKALEERFDGKFTQMEQRLSETTQQLKEHAVQMERKIDKSIIDTKITLRWFIGIVVALVTGATGIIIAFINLLVNGNGM